MVTGIEQLRAMLVVNDQPPICRTLGFALIEVDEGRAVFEGVPDEIEDDLLDLVSNFSGTINCLVTSQIASWLLDLNTGNRPVLKAHVDRFRTILQTKRWQNTGEPIIVSREGVLNDVHSGLTHVP